MFLIINIVNNHDSSYSPGFYSHTNEKNDSFIRNYENNDKNDKKDNLSKYYLLANTSNNNININNHTGVHHQHNSSYTYLERKNSQTSELNEGKGTSNKIIGMKKLNLSNINKNMSRLTTSNINNHHSSNNQKNYSYLSYKNNDDSNSSTNMNSTYKTYTQYVKNKNVLYSF